MTREIKQKDHHHHHHHHHNHQQPYLVRAPINRKAANLWFSFPDRIGIWSVGLSLCVTLSMEDIKMHHIINFD